MPRGFRDEDSEPRFHDGEHEHEPVTFEDAYADRETPLALLCVIALGGRKHEKWIPKSQIHDDSEVFRKGDQGKLVVTGWFAEKEGLG
jgi:hypothetical protein